MTDMKHTKTPWLVDKDHGAIVGIVDAHNRTILHTASIRCENRTEITRFIVKACNAYEENQATIKRLKGELKAARSEFDREFDRGYSIACCNLSNLYNEPHMAATILQELGVTKASVGAMGLGEYDLDAINAMTSSMPGLFSEPGNEND